MNPSGIYPKREVEATEDDGRDDDWNAEAPTTVTAKTTVTNNFIFALS